MPTAEAASSERYVSNAYIRRREADCAVVELASTMATF